MQETAAFLCGIVLCIFAEVAEASGVRNGNDVFRNLDIDDILEFLRHPGEGGHGCDIRLSLCSAIGIAHEAFSFAAFDPVAEFLRVTRKFDHDALAFAHLEGSDTLERVNDGRNIAIGILDNEFLEFRFFEEGAFEFTLCGGPLLREIFHGDGFRNASHIDNGGQVAGELGPVFPEIKENIRSEKTLFKDCSRNRFLLNGFEEKIEAAERKHTSEFRQFLIGVKNSGCLDEGREQLHGDVSPDLKLLADFLQILETAECCHRRARKALCREADGTDPSGPEPDLPLQAWRHSRRAW